MTDPLFICDPDDWRAELAELREAIAAPGIGGVTTRSDLKEANPTTPPAAMDDPRTDESGAT